MGPCGCCRGISRQNRDAKIRFFANPQGISRVESLLWETAMPFSSCFVLLRWFSVVPFPSCFILLQWFSFRRGVAAGARQISQGSPGSGEAGVVWVSLPYDEIKVK